MNILVTGSQGFLARNLSKRLKRNNFKIYGIGRGAWKKNDHKNWGYIKNINSDISLKNLFVYRKIKFHYIVHCAGKVIGLKPEDDFKRNVLTTQSILEFASLLNNKTKFIFMSTLAVYGNSKKSILKEEMPIRPISNYALNKLLAENICDFYFQRKKIDLLIARAGSLYGPGLKRQFIYDACRKIKANKNIFFGTGEEIRDWLYLDDFTELIHKIIKKSFSGKIIINVGSGKGIKIKDVINFINHKLSKNIDPIFNNFGSDSNPKKLISSIKKAKKFNWKPKTNFYYGLNEYIKWFKNPKKKLI